MDYFLIALISPILWAISNHVDKYLITKYFKAKGVGSLVIFSAIIGIFLLPIIFFIDREAVFIDFNQSLLIMASGMLYIIALIPYLYAMQKDETSTVVPIFQTIPFFTYFLGLIFLNEHLTLVQISASLLIILGAIGISLDLNGEKIKIKKETLYLMLLSSLIFSLTSFIFKFVAINQGFWSTAFYEYIGFSIIAVLLFFIPSYREEIFFVLEKNKAKVITINAFNEIINIIAKIIMNFATLLAPLALIWVINSIQPFFVLIFGIVITLFLPQFGREIISKRSLVQKLISIIVMFLGVYFLTAR